MEPFRPTLFALAAVASLAAASAHGQEPSPAPRTPAASAVMSEPPTVAVMEFDFAAAHQWWAVEGDIGRGIADLVTDRLVNSGTYRVIERRYLESILDEQDLAADVRRSDPAASGLVRAGRLLGAQYLVVGSVTRFGTEDRTAGGAAGGMARAIGVGLVGRQKGKAAVGIAARLVDATTGIVLASTTGEGRSSRSGLLLGGLASRGFGGVSMQSSAFRETILGEATEQAVHQVVERLVAATPRPPRNAVRGR